MSLRDDLLKRSRQLAGIEEGKQDWTLRKKATGDVGGADIDEANAAIEKVVAQLGIVAEHVKGLQDALSALGEAAQAAEEVTPGGRDVSPLSRRVSELQQAADAAVGLSEDVEVTVAHMAKLGKEATRMIEKGRAES